MWVLELPLAPPVLGKSSLRPPAAGRTGAAQLDGVARVRGQIAGGAWQNAGRGYGYFAKAERQAVAVGLEIGRVPYYSGTIIHVNIARQCVDSPKAVPLFFGLSRHSVGVTCYLYLLESEGRFTQVNSMSGLVPKLWYRSPFDQFEQSEAEIPPTDSSKIRPGCDS